MKKKTTAWLKINSQEYTKPILSLNVDAAVVVEGQMLPHQPLIVEFLGQQKRIITPESGLLEKESIRFECIVQSVRDKIKIWAENIEGDASEYEIISEPLKRAMKANSLSGERARNNISNLETDIQERDKEVNNLKAKLEEATGRVKKLEIEIGEARRTKKNSKPNVVDKIEEIQEPEATKVLKKESVEEGEELHLEEGTYKIERDLIIERGGALIIDPNVILEFGEDGGIICRGEFFAEGTKEEPIVFTSQKRGMRWKNITFEQCAVGSIVLEHCHIDSGGGRNVLFDEEIEKYSISPNLAEVQEHSDNVGGGIAFIQCEGDPILHFIHIKECEASFGGGIFVYKSDGLELKNCKIELNVAQHVGGILLWDSWGWLHDICITKNKTKGDVYTGEASGILIKLNAEKGLSRLPEIKDCEISFNYGPSAESGGLHVTARGYTKNKKTLVRKLKDWLKDNHSKAEHNVPFNVKGSTPPLTSLEQGAYKDAAIRSKLKEAKEREETLKQKYEKAKKDHEEIEVAFRETYEELKSSKSTLPLILSLRKSIK